jgi:hypothetical protein
MSKAQDMAEDWYARWQKAKAENRQQADRIAELERALADEREQCAKVAEGFDCDEDSEPLDIARAIRARTPSTQGDA